MYFINIRDIGLNRVTDAMQKITSKVGLSSGATEHFLFSQISKIKAGEVFSV